MFPLIGKARPRSWCQPPCVLWLCHKCRNWKGVRRSMIEPLPPLNMKRFQVALSFAGEHRSFVESVAEQLSRNLGQNRVFYDRYYEAELARPNLDTYLTNIYREEADLIAIFYVPTTHKRTGVVWNGEWYETSLSKDVIRR